MPAHPKGNGKAIATSSISITALAKLPSLSITQEFARDTSLSTAEATLRARVEKQLAASFGPAAKIENLRFHREAVLAKDDFSGLTLQDFISIDIPPPDTDITMIYQVSQADLNLLRQKIDKLQANERKHMRKILLEDALEKARAELKSSKKSSHNSTQSAVDAKLESLGNEANDLRKALENAMENVHAARAQNATYTSQINALQERVHPIFRRSLLEAARERMESDHSWRDSLSKRGRSVIFTSKHPLQEQGNDAAHVTSIEKKAEGVRSATEYERGLKEIFKWLYGRDP